MARHVFAECAIALQTKVDSFQLQAACLDMKFSSFGVKVEKSLGQRLLFAMRFECGLNRVKIVPEVQQRRDLSAIQENSAFSVHN